MSKFITVGDGENAWTVNLRNVHTVCMRKVGSEWWVEISYRASLDNFRAYRGLNEAEARAIFEQINAALFNAAPSTQEQPEFRICDIEDPTPEGYTCVLAFSSRGESFALYRRLP